MPKKAENEFGTVSFGQRKTAFGLAISAARNPKKTRNLTLLLTCPLLEIRYQQGVIVERWDNIDGYLVAKLLQDPRFPKLPTSLQYNTEFSEPHDWGTNYGSRVRGYFVPLQTGYHIFQIGIRNGEKRVKTANYLNNLAIWLPAIQPKKAITQ